jgi:hypothetical protein
VEDPIRFWELVTKAGKPSKFDLSHTGKQIIQAWFAAYYDLTGWAETRLDPSVKPTLFEVKRQYVRLFLSQEKKPDDITEQQWFHDLQFLDKKLPPDASFRKTLASVKQWFHDLQFLDKKLPTDATFRKTLGLVKLPWRKVTGGRPKGSKDTVKGTR